MKCPHCNYEHGWSGELLDNILGDEGEFFVLHTNMNRESKMYKGYIDTAALFACPACMKTFIKKQ